MNEEMTLTLNSPITDKQWDAITDVDFEHAIEVLERVDDQKIEVGFNKFHDMWKLFQGGGD